MTAGSRRLTVSAAVRAAASFRGSGPAFAVIALAAIALVVVDRVAPSAFFISEILALAATETVLFVTWLSRSTPGFEAVLAVGARSLAWIACLALLRSALISAALVAAAVVGILVAQGQGPLGAAFYAAAVAFGGIVAMVVVGRFVCAGPIVVTHSAALGQAMQKSWAATAGSVPAAALLTFGVFVVDVALQVGLGPYGIVGLVVGLIVGSVVAAAVQAGAYLALFGT